MNGIKVSVAFNATSQVCPYKDIEDICYFGVNTINCFIECNKNISFFHECEARVKI